MTTFTFKGDEFILTLEKDGKQGSDISKVKVDPSKKPAEITITEASGKIQLGIYEQNGDTLKLCVAEPGETPRPKTFGGKAPEASRIYFYVLTRDKK